MHLLKRRSRGLSAKPAKRGLVNPPPELAKVGATRCGVPDFSPSEFHPGAALGSANRERRRGSAVARELRWLEFYAKDPMRNVGLFAPAGELVWCLINTFAFAARDLGRRRDTSDEHIRMDL